MTTIKFFLLNPTKNQKKEKATWMLIHKKQKGNISKIVIVLNFLLYKKDIYGTNCVYAALSAKRRKNFYSIYYRKGNFAVPNSEKSDR